MAKQERKYIYINNLDFGGTVFQTQVLDWLYLYQKHNLDFKLIQVFHIKYLKRPGFLRNHLVGLRKHKRLYAGSIFMFPSKSYFYLVNSILIFLKILKYLFSYHEILIFSRALIGREIIFLKRISPVNIIFYYDARAASAEENKYIAFKQRDFSRSKFLIIANAYYLEYQTVLASDKIFSVSKALMNYYINTFAAEKAKFVSYPCLSDSGKFYYDHGLRIKTRNDLGLNESTLVFIYSGGIGNEWHMLKSMVTFYNEILKHEEDVIFLMLSNHKDVVAKTVQQFPALRKKLISFSVPNNEVCKYLNAADFGIIFRENTIMNNVASPTKFAEYMMCGLPAIISEGVGDYSEYVLENEVGVLLKESEFKDPSKFDFKKLLGRKYQRSRIAEFGQQFGKESIISNLIEKFRT